MMERIRGSACCYGRCGACVGRGQYEPLPAAPECDLMRRAETYELGDAPRTRVVWPVLEEFTLTAPPFDRERGIE